MKTDVCDILMIHYKRGEQILVARSPWRLNVVRYLLIFVDPQSLTYFITPSRRLEFCSVHTNFFLRGQICAPLRWERKTRVTKPASSESDQHH